jgi:phage tail sheath gpL-like
MLTFNNIPNTTRTPGIFTEIDNSRALQGQVPNPYKVLIIGQKVSEGSAELDTLYQLTSDGLANGYFGPGSILARMANIFKENNKLTELYAVAIGDPAGGVAASATIKFSVALSATGFSLSGTAPINLMLNGIQINETLYSGWSTTDINSAVQSTINADSTLPMKASTNAASALNLIAAQVGSQGNYLDARFNYYDGQSHPTGFGDSAQIITFAGGVGVPDIGDTWAVIDGQQFHCIIQPYVDSSNLGEIETELAERFGPMVDLWGHGFTFVRGNLASCTALGMTRNSPHNTIMGNYDSPSAPEEWAAALGAIASFNLNQDPARPLHYLQLKGVVPPPKSSRFTRAERDILLYDGIATNTYDDVGNPLIERCITTYRTNALGIIDPSYLDIQTLATLAEIRYQYKARMVTRFILPRFKLADDGFPADPGTYVVTPKTLKQEIIALFAELRDAGLVENLDDFISNLIVERSTNDVNRVNVLLPPDLINQFRVLASIIQFIL